MSANLEAMRLMARVVKRAMQLREESWTHVETKYALTHRKAAEMACAELGASPFMEDPVMLLIYYAWNDIQEWAEELDG